MNLLLMMFQNIKLLEKTALNLTKYVELIALDIDENEALIFIILS